MPGMTTHRDPIYAGHRFPPEIISHAVWLYFRFPLSFRMVEEMLTARGITVTSDVNASSAEPAVTAGSNCRRLVPVVSPVWVYPRETRR